MSKLFYYGYVCCLAFMYIEIPCVLGSKSLISNTYGTNIFEVAKSFFNQRPETIHDVRVRRNPGPEKRKKGRRKYKGDVATTIVAEIASADIEHDVPSTSSIAPETTSLISSSSVEGNASPAPSSTEGDTAQSSVGGTNANNSTEGPTANNSTANNSTNNKGGGEDPLSPLLKGGLDGQDNKTDPADIIIEGEDIVSPYSVVINKLPLWIILLTVSLCMLGWILLCVICVAMTHTRFGLFATIDLKGSLPEPENTKKIKIKK